jgi:hypothetical protein
MCGYLYWTVLFKGLESLRTFILKYFIPLFLLKTGAYQKFVLFCIVHRLFSVFSEELQYIKKFNGCI